MPEAPSGMDLRLRDARPGDEHGIQRIVGSVLAEFGWERDADGLDADLADIHGSYVARGGRFLVLVDSSDAIAGCCGLYPLDAQTAELRKMYFEPRVRGMGWGRQILVELLAHARRQGLHRVVLESNSRLRAAAALYRSLGFVESRRDHFHSRSDVAMELVLAPAPGTADLRYPIGTFDPPAVISIADRRDALRAIAETPAALRAAVGGLTEVQLDTRYRPGGWTLRQVVHHVLDSYLHGYLRTKFVLTEDTPGIAPYDEAKWADLVDSTSGPVDDALGLLDAISARWLFLLGRIGPAAFARSFVHPQWEAPQSLDMMLVFYAWHGRHHTAQVAEYRRRQADRAPS